MRFSEFVSAGLHVRVDVGNDPACARLLSTRLRGYLAGEGTAPEPTRVREPDECTRRMTEDPASTSDLPAPAAHGLGLLSRPVLSMWRPILGAGPPPDPLERRRSQLALALQATRMLLRRRDETVADTLLATPARAAQDQLLTDLDTMVALLEAVRPAPDTLVLPAPPPASSADRGPGADLLVLDLRARGIATVRARASRSAPARGAGADPSVVMIDGERHLGNERLVPLHPTTASKGTAPWPGLLSAHFVLRHAPRSPLTATHRVSVERLRRQLPAAIEGSSDRLRRAVAHVDQRVTAAIQPR